MSFRWISYLCLAMGLALLAWLLWDMDVRGMAGAIGRIGWRGLVLLPLAFLWLIPNTIAWDYSFKAPGSGIPFRRLLLVRIAGETLNDLLPSGNLGGEPVKAMLLRPEVSFTAALSSLTVAKTTQTLSLLIFILGGLGLAAWHTPLPPEVYVTAVGVLAMLGGGTVVLIFGAGSGLLGKWAGALARRFPNAAWVASLTSHARELDACLSDFYGKERRRFAASTFWHLAGLVVGSAELYLIAALLGLPMTLSGALVMEAVTTLFGVGGFFIPGSIGAFEFGHFLAAGMLGLPPSSGVLMSLIRRGREIFWLVAGLFILYVLYPESWKRRPAEGEVL